MEAHRSFTLDMEAKRMEWVGIKGRDWGRARKQKLPCEQDTKRAKDCLVSVPSLSFLCCSPQKVNLLRWRRSKIPSSSHLALLWAAVAQCPWDRKFYCPGTNSTHKSRAGLCTTPQVPGFRYIQSCRLSVFPRGKWPQPPSKASAATAFWPMWEQGLQVRDPKSACHRKSA